MPTSSKKLPTPKSSFATHTLSILTVDPCRLIRVSAHNTGEPYFGKSGVNRFDDPSLDPAYRYGTCYFGYKLSVAVAETLLHNEAPVGGHFLVHADRIAARFVVHYQGRPLRLANLTGASLKRIGLHAGLSGTSYYKTPQKWSKAIYDHPDLVDGFVYMSHHMNTDKAVVLFERAGGKVQMATAIPLPSYLGFARVAKNLGIRTV